MKKISTKNALLISIGFIVAYWIYKVVRNTCYIDSILELFESIPKVLMIAFVTGLLTILIVTLLLRLANERYKDIGFNKLDFIKQLRNGFLFGLLIFILDKFLISPLVDALLPEISAKGIDMSILFNNAYLIVAFMLIALFKGGFSEELLRIFILSRFEKAFGKFGLIFALIVGSVVFGIGHFYQGVGGMISVGIIGLLYTLVYLRKRLAFEAIIAHATFNLISITLGTIIYYGK